MGESPKLEVHVAGFCFHEGKVLLAKRSPHRKRFPNKWECGGGKVEHGENFPTAVERELLEELGIIVEVLGPANFYDIRAEDLEQELIPGVHAACKFIKYANGQEPKISDEHTEYAWAGMDELDNYDMIEGLPEAIRIAYSLYFR